MKKPPTICTDLPYEPAMTMCSRSNASYAYHKGFRDCTLGRPYNDGVNKHDRHTLVVVPPSPGSRNPKVDDYRNGWLAGLAMYLVA
jgi:hypothetical protein